MDLKSFPALVASDSTRRLPIEVLAKSFARDEASAHCREHSTPIRDVEAVLRAFDERAESCDAAIEAAVPALRIKRSLGRMGDTCGARSVRVFDDVRALSVSASDMGISRRVTYQLGDRLFAGDADDRFEASALPCGVRLRFRADYRDAHAEHATMLH